MGNTPDVRVRLSAEGVAEVVAAMKKIQAEAAKTEGVKAMNKAFSELGNTLLGGLGIAAVVEGIASVTKKALDNAVAIGRMEQKIGSSAEMLSVLTVAAEDAGVSQEDLGTGLVKLAHSMDQAAQGSAKPLNAFQRLGISMKDVKNNDPGQMLVLVANRMSGMADGTKKAAIAQDLFGRSGANLIPVMDKLADGGFERVREKAERMGLVLSQDVVDGVERAHAALMDMSHLAEGIATQFLSGFAPAAADAMESLNKSVTGAGVKGFQGLGTLVGYIAKFIVFTFQVVGQTVGTILSSLVDILTRGFQEMKTDGVAAIEAIKAAAHGDWGGVKSIINAAAKKNAATDADGLRRQGAIWKDFGSQVAGDWKDMTGSTKPIGSIHKGSGGTDDGNLQAIAKARLDFLKAQADNELAILKTKNQLEGQENDRDFHDGFISLEQYYDRRAELIRDESDAELETLKKKRDLVANAPAKDTAEQIKRKKEVAALDTQIAQKELETQGKLAQNEDDRYNATIKHRITVLETEGKIATAEGDRNKAAQLALDAEILKTEELLEKQGMAADKIKQILDAMRSAGQGRVNFGAASQAGSTINSDLDFAKRDIQRMADTGEITAIQAQAQILSLERDRVASLKAIGEQMTINAELSKDPALIEQAKSFNAAVKDLEASTNLVGKAMAKLTNEVTSQGIQAFNQFFVDSVTGAKSFKQAWQDLAKSFEQIIAQMIAKLVEMYLMMLIMNLIKPGAPGVGKSTSGSVPFGSVDSDFSFAHGGYTGDGGVFQPAGVVHRGEFVSDQQTTRRFRPLLEWMQSGSMRGIKSSWGYAGGGYVSGNGGGSPVTVNVDTNGQPATTTQRQGPDGKTIIDVIVGQVAQNIAQGGKVHQAIQQTYGIGRVGRKIV